MDDLRAGRGDPWEHDPGPPRNRAWGRLFAETPDHRALAASIPRPASGPELLRWRFGPVFYRGRLGDNQVKVLVVASAPDPDDVLAHRALVGEAGCRVQNLLHHLGITRSYLFLNAVVYAPARPGGAALDRLALDPDSPVALHRDRLLDYAAARNDLRLVVAVGRLAREAVLAWNRRRGGSGSAGPGRLHRVDASALGPHVRLVDVADPGDPGRSGAAADPGDPGRSGAAAGTGDPGHRGAEVAASFAAAAERVLGWARDNRGWLPADSDGRRGRPSIFRFDRAAVPLRDLPFGTPWRLGAGDGSAVCHAGGRHLDLVAGGHDPGGDDYEPAFPHEHAGGGRDGYDHDLDDVPWEPPRSAVEFDRGPGPSMARLLVGGSAGLAWPDFAALGVPGAASFGGGALYRGRFTGVRVLVVADPAGHDDLLWGRAFTGEAGQRFQGLLAALGITRSYLVLRSLPVDTAGLPAGQVGALADRPDVVALHRVVAGRVLDDNQVAVVVTVGPHAERIAATLDLDGQPVVSLPAWSATGARDVWASAHRRLRSLGVPIDQPPTGTAWNGGRAQIPRADLPFGLPRWQGSSGDRVVREKRVAGVPGERAPAYRVWVPRWVDALGP